MQAEEPASGDDVASSGISDVGVSGVRVERETTPAPAGTSGTWAALPSAFPSAHPTHVPAYDVAAHAFETSMRHLPLPSLPLDVAIPSRTTVVTPPDLELRLAFLLLHVDGRSTVTQIAEVAAIPFEDVLTLLLALSARGLVELAGSRSLHAPPVSGERPRGNGER